ncbi:Uncharacterised protein [Chlamydia trachomatis]|nr:Uncharacterised protein [Chlamydia trachomatis]
MNCFSLFNLEEFMTVTASEDCFFSSQVKEEGV